MWNCELLFILSQLLYHTLHNNENNSYKKTNFFCE